LINSSIFKRGQGILFSERAYLAADVLTEISVEFFNLRRLHNNKNTSKDGILRKLIYSSKKLNIASQDCIPVQILTFKVIIHTPWSKIVHREEF
jgi:hypothetical protein